MAQLVRALNSTGIERFRAYLARLRGGISADPPRELLEDAAYASELMVEVMVEERGFASRLDAGKYLYKLLGALPPEDAERNKGLWAWMSLFFFDQVCPKRKDGARRPGQDYRHIPDFSYRNRHRHLLYGPYQVYRRHGADAILLLSGPVHSENAIYHEIASRQDLIANKGVVEAALNLYLDRTRAAPKQGSQDPKAPPGTIRRFVRVLQQLEVTYDIYGLSGKQILELLPREFNAWRT
jgi:hypothetical protein